MRVPKNADKYQNLLTFFLVLRESKNNIDKYKNVYHFFVSVMRVTSVTAKKE